MNRTKSILLAATALATLGVAQQASAQTEQASVVLLPAPVPDAAAPSCSPSTTTSGLYVSNDGSRVIGSVQNNGVGVGVECPVVWTNGAPTLVRGLPDPARLPANNAQVDQLLQVSGDGRVLIVTTDHYSDGIRALNGSSNITYFAPAMASASGGLTFFPTPSTAHHVIGALSNFDGSIFYLQTTTSDIESVRPREQRANIVTQDFRWSPTTGFEPITLGFAPLGMDGAGNRLVGVDTNGRAFEWLAGRGSVQLPFLSNAATPAALALAISRDGSTIVGSSRDAADREQAVYWRGGAVTGLGFLAFEGPDNVPSGMVRFSQASAASGDGRVIIGTGSQLTNGNFSQLPWRWTASLGMQELNAIVQSAGLNLNGFVLNTALGISDNGQHITGFANNAGLNQSLGFVLSIAAAPPVPDPVLGVAFLPLLSAGTASCSIDSTRNTFAQTISADGQTVVGQANSDCLAIWRNASPGVLDDSGQLQTNGFGINLATGMSADGSVIVGTEASFPTRTVIWTAATGSYRPPEPVPGQRAAFGEGYVSSDGTIFAFNTLAYTVLAGSQTINATSAPARVYRWSAANGFEDIGTLGTQYRMIAHGISGAGSTIVGTAVIDSTITAPLGQESAAFVWRSGSGLAALPQLVATPQGAPYLPYAEANGISRDGSTIVGASRGANGLVQATFWRAGTATGLGFLSGLTPASADSYAINTTRAFAANADGSVIVGTTFGAESGTAWRWTAANGMQDLNLVARNAGLDLGSFVLTDAVGLSDNGQFITGNSTDGTQFRGYVFSIAAAPPVPDPVLGVTFLVAPAGSDAGANTSVGGITADGMQVSGSNLNIPVVWQNGVANRFDPAGRYINQRISGNGLAMSGYNPDQQSRNAIIWTAATGSILLPNRSETELATGSSAIDSSGTIFAVNTGTFDPNSTFISRNIAAYRWTMAGGYQSLGSFGPTWAMRGNGISGDGSIIVGEADNRSVSPAEPFIEDRAAFRWSASGGLSRLADLSETPLGGSLASHSIASNISRDGTTIVGESRGANGLVQATFWRAGTITGLGFLPGQAAPTATGTNAPGTTHALAANIDGSVIVGRASTLTIDRAWRWTLASGMEDLNQIARNAGIDLGSFVLTDAVGLSDNGEFVTGNSTDGTLFRGYVFGITRVVPPPTPTTFETTSRLIITLRLPGVTQTSIVNQSFSTQVDATLNGTNVFTRTVGAAIDSTAGTTALTAARTALQQGAGLRRVTIGAPTMVSNVTTVLGMTSTTTDVPSGTQITTASVTTPGAATVATGNLGTCATPAATNINPTGCSLPGTTVAVGSNEININTFTNTIASVTPTTTRTVDQLITAKWVVAATSGNQFGTVHALVGPAAFERSDRLIAQLIGMGGGNTNDRANGVTRAATPMRSARGFGEGDGNGLTMFGGYFNNRSRIDADASVPVARVRGSTDGFVLGLEQALGNDAHIGVAVDHGTSDVAVRDPLYGETLTLKQTQVAAFAGWASNGVSLDAAGSYGFGTARTAIATPGGAANARRDTSSWSLGAQAGYTVPLGDDASIALVTGVRHVSARLDGFTETGGSSPLIGIASRVDRTRIYAGIEAEARIELGGLTITPRLHARAARDSGDISGTADLVFASTPNAAPLQAVGPGVGRTVAELGGSVEMAVGSGVTLWGGYDTHLRDGARSNTAKVGASVRF